MEHFCHEFSMFGHEYIFFFFIVICSHLRCYITSIVRLIMCALCEKKQFKKVNQKRKDVIFSSTFLISFDMCFHNLIKIYVAY